MNSSLNNFSNWKNKASTERNSVFHPTKHMLKWETISLTTPMESSCLPHGGGMRMQFPQATLLVFASLNLNLPMLTGHAGSSWEKKMAIIKIRPSHICSTEMNSQANPVSLSRQTSAWTNSQQCTAHGCAGHQWQSREAPWLTAWDSCQTILTAQIRTIHSSRDQSTWWRIWPLVLTQHWTLQMSTTTTPWWEKAWKSSSSSPSISWVPGPESQLLVLPLLAQLLSSVSELIAVTILAKLFEECNLFQPFYLQLEILV